MKPRRGPQFMPDAMDPTPKVIGDLLEAMEFATAHARLTGVRQRVAPFRYNGKHLNVWRVEATA